MGALPKGKKRFYLEPVLATLKVFLSSLCLFSSLSVSHAQLRTEWHLDATLQEQYNDNLNLSSQDPPKGLYHDFLPGGPALAGFQDRPASL